MRTLRSSPVLLAALLALPAMSAIGPSTLVAQTPPGTATPAAPSSAPSPAVPKPGDPQPAAAGTPAIVLPGQAAKSEPGVPTTTGAPAKAPGAPVPVAAPPDPNRIEFNLNFPKEQGGGSAAGSAASLEYVRETFAVLAGNVKVKYQDMDISADRAEIDLQTKLVTATGHVIVDQGPRRMSGDTLKFDLDTKTGTLENATAQVQPDYYFTGREISKTGDDTYEVVDGVFTSCSQKVPDWSFKLGRAEVEVEGYARIHSATLKAKKLPVFYTPYILWPAKSERTSGLLIPNLGYSATRGALFGLAYYQVLGRSYDTTFHFDDYSKKYFGVGDEFRYHPTEGTIGAFLGYAIKDPTVDRYRWKVLLNHVTEDLPFGMRGVISYQKVSDFNYYRDFERDLNANSLRSIYSRGFITGNWGPNLLNFLVDDRSTFVDTNNTNTFTSANSIVQRKLPELEYRLRSTELGKLPLYLQFQGSLDYLDIARPGSYAGRYGRADLFPELTLPIRTFPWLSLSVTGGERLTWYGNKVDPTGTKFTGGGLTRNLPEASAELVGPSFTRIFGGFGSFSKLKHVIEPRWSYTYQGAIDRPEEIPLFDEVDFQSAMNVGRIALDNRLLGKPRDEKKGSAREILLVEVARSYSFDPKQPLQTGEVIPPTETGPQTPPLASKAGPIEGLIRFNPTEVTSLKYEVTYDTLFKRLSGTALSGNLALGPDTVGLSWFTRYLTQTGEKQSDQVGISAGLEILPKRLHLDAQISFDAQNHLLQQQRYIASWASQCFGFQVELRDYRSGTGPFATRTTDYRFSLSLKNVGTFLDLTGRAYGGQ